MLVHGWSKPLRQLDVRYGEPTAFLRDRFGNQSRWTTPQVLEDIKKVSDTLGKEVSDRLGRRGIEVERLRGSDGLITAGRGERTWWRGRELVEIDNLVGPIIDVDASILWRHGLGTGRCCLVTPLARDIDGREVNTDADRAAAALAGATAATALTLVTDVSHLIVDGSPVDALSAEAAAEFRDRSATGGMRKKLRAAAEALDHGVGRVVIGSATVSELLAGRTGTVIANV